MHNDCGMVLILLSSSGDQNKKITPPLGGFFTLYSHLTGCVLTVSVLSENFNLILCVCFWWSWSRDAFKINEYFLICDSFFFLIVLWSNCVYIPAGAGSGSSGFPVPGLGEGQGQGIL